MMKKEKLDPVRKDAMDTHNIGEASFWFSAWIGALFYYGINRRQKSLKELSDEKFIKKNVITGWLINMVVIFGGLFLVLKIMNSF